MKQKLRVLLISILLLLTQSNISYAYLPRDFRSGRQNKLVEALIFLIIYFLSLFAYSTMVEGHEQKKSKLFIFAIIYAIVIFVIYCAFSKYFSIINLF